MSKIKNPQEKKQQSYANDCRNAYGANDKCSRKSIRRNKQLGAQIQRSTRKKLNGLQGQITDEDFATKVESEVMSAVKLKRRSGFKKYSDQPLASHIMNQTRKRNERFGRRVALRLMIHKMMSELKRAK